MSRSFPLFVFYTAVDLVGLMLVLWRVSVEGDAAKCHGAGYGGSMFTVMQ